MPDIPNQLASAGNNDDLNLKISEFRDPSGGSWERTCRGLSLEGSWYRSRRRHFKDDKVSGYWHIKPRDWTGSEDANAILLDEMPWADLSKQDPSREWRCDPLGGAEGPDGDGFSIYDKDRKTAIALAWCKWKGIA